MPRILLQLVITIVLFFATWFVLSQISWVQVFGVEKKANKLEEELGKLLEKQILTEKDTTRHPQVYRPVIKLLHSICKANDIDSTGITMHIVDDSEINAFALPSGIMVINKGLILESENEQALAGVIGHELAHITEKHVMRRLIRELGLAMLVNMTSGSSGSGISQIMKELTSSSYDRELETEADMKAVEFLENADLDPRPFAEFMYFMSTLIEVPEALQWLSTHPESEERSKAILEARDEDKDDFVDLIDDEAWGLVKSNIKSY